MYAFEDCILLSEVVIPNSIDVIDIRVFYGCESLKEITIPYNAKKIENCAFENCFNLRSVTLPKNIETIGNWAFANCKIAEVFYGGTEEQWNVLSIGTDNDCLIGATKYFDHIYQNILGDVNNDYQLNIRDATAIQKYLASLIEFEEQVESIADYNCDGNINIKDATAIQKKIAGLI